MAIRNDQPFLLLDIDDCGGQSHNQNSSLCKRPPEIRQRTVAGIHGVIKVERGKRTVMKP